MVNLPWLEIESLSREIANLEDRLRAARSTRKDSLAALLEQQLEDAKGRRPRLIAAVARQIGPAAPAPKAEPAPPPEIVWNRLNRRDLDWARHDLEARRAAALARHAEELQALDTERDEIDGLERAIAAFLGKFGARPHAAVVRLDRERQLRVKTPA